ncbi:hypothetical protein F5Y15DRAFT_364830 [Xylariaceae sp. FL0016]|nr:hypothetical protein F5Y15DRAFT_364830 [Xylariaceae sp. FL0016]
MGETNVQASPRAVASSHLSLKRLRDYGEELKGLPSSDGEDDQQPTSSPATKKLRTDGGDDRSGSDSLDDGEIVEPVPPTEAAEPTSLPHQSLEHSQLASATLEVDRLPKAPSEPLSSDPNIQQPETTAGGWHGGLKLGVCTTFDTKSKASFFPGLALAAGSSQPSSVVSRDDQFPSQDTHANNGPLASVPTGETDPPTNAPPLGMVEFRCKKRTWKIPIEGIPKIKTQQTNVKQTPFWTREIRLFVNLLLRSNPSQAEFCNYKVVHTGWGIYLRGKNCRIEGTNASVKEPRRIAKEVFSSLPQKQVIQMIVDGRNAKEGQLTTSPFEDENDENGGPSQSVDHTDSIESALSVDMDDDTHSIVSVSSGVPRDNELLQQQTKYFPGTEHIPRLCLSCSGIGHTFQDCPHLSCRFCRSEDHRSYGCPEAQRCGKCRQLGHKGENCTEKLALAPEEQGACAFCSADHTDEHCSEIWRTYSSSPKSPHKVNDIPAFCYSCGSMNHYGPECALPPRRKGNVSDRTTWSQANREQYVDPQSENVAAAWDGIGLNPSLIGVQQDFHIPGQATRKTHLHFTSSDESDEDLVHAPVKRPQPRGEIRIASNISSIPNNINNSTNSTYHDRPQQSFRRRNERSVSPPLMPRQVLPPYPSHSQETTWRPPLPPGPPPSFSNDYHSTGSRPANLPPRPQAFDTPSNRGGRSGHSGRNGYRNRGRSRSRGRGRGRG